MLKNLFTRFFPKNEPQLVTEEMKARQKIIASVTAVIFALMGLAFFLWDVNTVVVAQKGHYDISDEVLMPVAALMFLLAISSFWLIRRNRLTLGTSLLFYSFVVVPPVMAILLLQNVLTTVILYLALLGTIMIAWVLSRSSRRLGGFIHRNLDRFVRGDRDLESGLPIRNQL